MTNRDFIFLNNIQKYYNGVEKSVLTDVNLTLNLGSSLSIQGYSGSGKSTLLYILGLLDKPNYGQYFLDNIDVLALNQSQKAKVRNQYIGFIFQNHQLIPYLSVVQNIRVPFIYRKHALSISWEKEILFKLNLIGLESRYPHELSLGQQQRVAIARALITQPKLILADEPTASLDPELAEIYMHLLLEYVQEKKAIYIMVTHDKKLAEQTQYQFYLS